MKHINDLPEDAYQAFEKKFNTYAYLQGNYAEIVLCAEHFFAAGYEAASAREGKKMVLPNRITVVRIESADKLTYAEMSLDRFYERVSSALNPIIRIPIGQHAKYSYGLDDVESIEETDRIFVKRYEHIRRQFAGIDGTFEVMMIIYKEKLTTEENRQ